MRANFYASRKHGTKQTRKQFDKEYIKQCGEVKTFKKDEYKPTIKEGYIRITL